MSARKTHPSPLHGIVAGLLLSASGAALLAALPPLGYGGALRAVVALLALAYVLYLLSASSERVGRIATVALWLVAAAAAWLAAPPLPLYLLIHAVLISLVRSLYFHSGALAALLDLGLTALGAAFAVWAALRTGSPFLAFWCFFLAQAFFVCIPAHGARAPCAGRSRHDDAFERAHRFAQEAARRLAAR